MNWLGIFIVILNGLSGLSKIDGFVSNNMNNIRLRKSLNMCSKNNFENCEYITEIVPIIPNKTKIAYINNNINYEIIVSVYTTYNNKNNLIFLNNGSYVEIYNKTLSYDNDKLQQLNIVSNAFYNRIISYLYKSHNVSKIF